MPCKKDNCACKDTTTSASHMPDIVKQSVFLSHPTNYVASNLDVVTVLVKKLENFFALPEYKSEGAVGMDLYSAEDIEINSSQTVLVSTGIVIALPEGYEAQIRARSGMAVKNIIVVNAPGTIDFDLEVK